MKESVLVLVCLKKLVSRSGANDDILRIYGVRCLFLIVISVIDFCWSSSLPTRLLPLNSLFPSRYVVLSLLFIVFYRMGFLTFCNHRLDLYSKALVPTLNEAALICWRRYIYIMSNAILVQRRTDDDSLLVILFGMR